MRRADEATISCGTPAETLMDRAGRAVARAVIQLAGGRYGTRVTVVCGKGNNGGDGFVAARVLHSEGLGVTCALVFDPAEAQGPAKHHLDLLRRSGCRIVAFDERLLAVDVIVDAVFGTGFSGEPQGPAAEALGAMIHAVQGEEVLEDEDGAYAVPAAWPTPIVVSVDVPSAGWVPADVTVALGAEKIQTFFEVDQTALVEVAEIGIEIEEARVAVMERADVVAALPRPSPADHKTSRGTVVVLGGSDATTGAPILTSRGAARMGSGYVTLASTAAVIDAAETLTPEVLKRRMPGESLGPDVLDDLSAVLERADCVAVGPGLGVGDGQRELVLRLLREFPGPVVVDADGLNNLVGRTEVLGGREWPVVITPHVAEMGRLLERPTPEITRARVDAALAAAERFGCVVVLKGHRTIVAATSAVTLGVGAAGLSDGSATGVAIPVGGPELATAGTGDVLTGAVATQMARGGHPQFAAAAGCYVHGVAGQIAAEQRGASGVVAWDVAEALPQAIERIRGPYAV